MFPHALLPPLTTCRLFDWLTVNKWNGGAMWPRHKRISSTELTNHSLLYDHDFESIDIMFGCRICDVLESPIHSCTSRPSLWSCTNSRHNNLRTFSTNMCRCPKWRLLRVMWKVPLYRNHLSRNGLCCCFTIGRILISPVQAAEQDTAYGRHFLFNLWNRGIYQRQSLHHAIIRDDRALHLEFLFWVWRSWLWGYLEIISTRSSQKVRTIEEHHNT